MKMIKAMTKQHHDDDQNDGKPVHPASRLPTVRLRVLTMAFGIRATMPAKMMSEMPLPMPFSVICSPSHIRNDVPAQRVIMVISRKPHPAL